MKFHEDQHKLAAYLERNPDAEWQWLGDAVWHWGGTPDTFLTPSEAVAAGHLIHPVLRYGLPSHLQSEIHNPDNLTEEQICEGGKYRACVKSDSANQPNQVWTTEDFEDSIEGLDSFGNYGFTYRLPATVPWPDWEQDDGGKIMAVVTETCAKDARIAELEKQISELHESCENLRKSNNYPTSPWRRMSEVPTEEDKKGERFLGRWLSGEVELIDYRSFDTCVRSNLYAAWMPVPKFHGWPDPLADLLKQHGIEATPELTAALTAWKGVEK